MRSIDSQPDRRKLQEDLRRRFIGSTTWPPDRASLTALVDLGLSDDNVANYFDVQPHDVATLRYAYGLAPSSAV